MQFYFIRHAQSEDNVQLANRGRDGMNDAGVNSSYADLQGDPELSETGRKQLDHLVPFLVGRNEKQLIVSPDSGNPMTHFNITHVYASLMVRSMETAGALANALDLSPMVWEDLHETGGIWTPDEKSGQLIGQPGNSRTFFEQRFPRFQLPDKLGDEGWWNRPLETSREIKERAQRFCSELIEKHGYSDDRVVTVGHGLFYSFILNVFLNIPPKSNIRFSLHNTGITRIDYIKGVKRIVYLNRTEHLPSDLIT